MRARDKALIVTGMSILLAAVAAGQAGRRIGLTPGGGPVERSVLLNVVITRDGGAAAQVKTSDLAIYDGGMEQAVHSLTPDPSPARIVLLVDNSRGLRADVEKLAAAAREFAYEIYEGDQLMVVGYDEKAEMITDWTDDPKLIEKNLSLLRKKGEPHLYDALRDVVSASLRPFTGSNRKRVVVLVGDGLDRGSRAKFEDVLTELQREDIAVYALQIPDRTGGALRRDRLKPTQAVKTLVEGTGGLILPFDEPRESAKTICDELRKDRYVLAYVPKSVPLYDTRRLLVLGSEGIKLRHKSQQPAQ